jgi:prolyl-tRNA synthetase
MLVRRDTGDKTAIPKDTIATGVENLLHEIQDNLFQQALKFRKENTCTVKSFDKFKSIIENNGGFVRCGWDGDAKTELKIKEETKATIRCILPDGDISGKTCVYSGNPAKYEVIFAKAY